MKATWNGKTIAESDSTVVVEDNHCFPPTSVEQTYLRESTRCTTCPWKGEAHYFDVVVEDGENRNAAWTYPQPKDDAIHIKDHVAFWKGVEITE